MMQLACKLLSASFDNGASTCKNVSVSESKLNLESRCRVAVAGAKSTYPVAGNSAICVCLSEA